MMVRRGGIRPPAVAGLFYPKDRRALVEQLEHCYRSPIGPGNLPALRNTALHKPVALVVPHAGYAYSGPVSAHAYRRLALLGKPSAIAILGPNHYGLGHPFSIAPHTHWETPLGALALDQMFGQTLVERMPKLTPDAEAHQNEHSIEVQLPFIIHAFGTDIPIVCISMSDQSLETSVSLGEALAHLIGEKSVALLASTDLSHYMPDSVARELDARIVECIKRLDAEALDKAVNQDGINMCGPGPVMATITCMKGLGAKQARVLCYATLGDTSGERREVVGYLAAEISLD